MVEINDESRGTYNKYNETRFKTSMLRSRLCDCSDAYKLVKGNIIVTNTGTDAATNKANKKVIFKKCTLFTRSISRLNNT